jgi:nickel-type superoxide dismutase maturation protease
MRVQISGDSMYPTYSDGEIVEVDTEAYAEGQLPEPGDVVLATHPFKRDVHLVKRVRELTEDGRVFLVGDAGIESADSRGFGALRRERILGKVI